MTDAIKAYRRKVREGLSDMRRLYYYLQSPDFVVGYPLLSDEKRKQFDNALSRADYQSALHIIISEDDNDPHTWNIKRLRATARKMRVPYYSTMLKHELAEIIRKDYEKASATALQQNHPVAHKETCGVV